jgi:hypothetical protein
MIEQPLEAVRTHPYHYRCYNLAAMIVSFCLVEVLLLLLTAVFGFGQLNAKLGDYLGLNFWNTSTKAGGNIQKANDFTMQQQLNTTDGDGPVWELYPSIATVASKYGDPDGKYAAFMANADNTYPDEPYFLFNQPFSDSNLAAATPTAGTTPSASAHHNGASETFGSGLFAGWFAVIFLSLLNLMDY